MERSVEYMIPTQTPKQRANFQRMKLEQKVFDLNGALTAFKNIMGIEDITKKLDVNIEGAKIAAVFENKRTGEKFLVMFKRDFYHQFSNHFPKIPEAGYGMIISKKIVEWAADEEMTLVAVMPRGVAYKCGAVEAIEYYRKWKTDVPHIEGEIGTPARMWPRLF